MFVGQYNPVDIRPVLVQTLKRHINRRSVTVGIGSDETVGTAGLPGSCYAVSFRDRRTSCVK